MSYSNYPPFYFVPTGITYQTVTGDNFDVGHTFVAFEKINTDGTSVTQTIGFYPSGNGINSRGTIKDNGGHAYDLSYTITVTSNQFSNALAKVADDFENKKYVLTNVFGNEYNCTDAGLSWMNAAGAGIGKIWKWTM